MLIFTKNDNLVIRLQGFERLWSLRRQIIVPFDKVISLEFHEKWQRPKNGVWLRLGGTFLPKFLMAGRFRMADEDYFAYVKGITGSGLGALEASNVAVVTTVDYPYRQIFLSVESPEDLPKF